MTIRRNLRIAAEIALAFATLGLIDRLAGAGTLHSLQPHPYWLPVLAMAVIYGTGEGLAAAGVATILWLAAPHAPLAIGEDPFHRLVALSMGPMLWVATAALIGEVSSARLRRIARLDRRAETLARNNEALTSAHRALSAGNRSLRIRIATEQRGVGEAIGMAAGLCHPHPAARLRTIARLIALDADSDDFSLYVEQAGVWRSHLRGPGAPTDIETLPSALVAATAATTTTPLAIGAPALDGVGVLALPVRTGADMAAILIFHDLPVERFTRRAMVDFAAVAARIAPLLADDVIQRAGQQTRLRVVGSDVVP